VLGNHASAKVCGWQLSFCAKSSVWYCLTIRYTTQYWHQPFSAECANDSVRAKCGNFSINCYGIRVVDCYGTRVIDVTAVVFFMAQGLWIDMAVGLLIVTAVGLWIVIAIGLWIVIAVGLWIVMGWQ
jgi:hypothetical protein